jgi:hypothetical protein
MLLTELQGYDSLASVDGVERGRGHRGLLTASDAAVVGHEGPYLVDMDTASGLPMDLRGPAQSEQSRILLTLVDVPSGMLNSISRMAGLPLHRMEASHVGALVACSD